MNNNGDNVVVVACCCFLFWSLSLLLNLAGNKNAMLK